LSPDPQSPTAPRLIETEIGDSDAPLAPATYAGLPDDLLRESARRLGIICLVAAAVWTVNLVLIHFVYAVPGTVTPEHVASYRQRLAVYDLVGGFNVVLALSLYWYIRARWRKPHWVLNLALGYEVFLALSVGVLDYAERGPAEGVSWIAVIILLFAAVLATSPRKTLIAAVVAASMGPVGALIWQGLGAEVPGPRQVFLLAIPNYLCAGLAFVISGIIAGLGREVNKARKMGSYVLGELIARGGMGEVWQATHRLLVRPAAIKLIRPEVLAAGTPDRGHMLVERFRREARAAAALHSPHTIQLYDFGVASDGTFYYVMELLNGMDLQRLVSEYGPLPAARTIHILRQICESLGEAHDRGLIHRDIKPANIQICRVARDCDYVKVLDFGLVKTQLTAEPDDLRLTAPNLIFGTPAYLSPEVGLGQRVDHRTDIYSLGCVAYWMLTARQVFEAESVMQMVVQHAQATPEPPSRRSGFPVSAALDEIVLACLAKDPADRPGTAWELSQRLSECQVESIWTRDDACRWWETRLQPEPMVSLSD
jgi:hypothetical protein